ncbi:MAG: methyl-accepting chemotaxis protein, partial [Gammaproteobacteria bacterium]|nr:methyl-accepting chemotaxis protein [Gammaproteobacteria bacterium]
LEKIVASVKKVSDIVAEIAAASREQSSGIEQVNRAVMQMDELTQQNAALVEEATAASQAMAEQVRGLNEMLARYRVAEAAFAATTNGAAAPRAAATTRADGPARSDRRGGQRPWAAKGGKPAAAAGGADGAATPARKTAARANGSGGDAEWREF